MEEKNKKKEIRREGGGGDEEEVKRKEGRWEWGVEEEEEQEVKVKLSPLVEGDLKAPISIATTPKCKEGRNSIPWIAPLYSWSLHYNTDC